MDIDDQELFESVTNRDEPIEAEVAEPAEATTDDVNRDEQGRFAAKAETTETPATAEPAGKDEAHVPSWRLREQTERAEAAERRSQQMQSDFERRFNELQSRLPRPETPVVPDVFENPDGFLQHGVRQAVDPVKNEISQLREFYSQKEAIREHGPEKVKAAYDAIAQGMQSRDPEVNAIYQRAMSSLDPYGEIVKWYQQKTVFAQIGSDPNKWFEQEVERRAKEDPAFLEKLKAASAPNPNAPQTPANLVRLPPSMNRLSTAAAPQSDGADMSDAELFAAATRRR